jgi:hypothetical protein
MRGYEQAVYKEQGLLEFKRNPLIEALPELMDSGEILAKLTKTPPYDRAHRLLTARERIQHAERLRQFHQPGMYDLDIAYKVARCIRWGYVNRNPREAQYHRELAEAYNNKRIGEQAYRYLTGYHPNTSGFTMVGVSGVGKSSTMEGVLSLCPQVIEHVSYEGEPLPLRQLVWMKIDCACDGTLKGLCRDFFEEMDRILGTRYLEAASGKNNTLDTLLLMLVQAARAHCLGLFVIDEIQCLSVSKSGGAEKMLNFFVTLVNKIGLPVVLIGTPKALPVLQGDFRQARRGSGQGDILWEMMPDGEGWNVFLEAMWPYQYTRDEVPLTEELRHAFYEETHGLAFLAVILYKLVQEDAIILGRETFGVLDVHRVADESLGMTKPMRDALRSGKELDLQKYTDIHPLRYSQFLDNYSVHAEKDVPLEVPDAKTSVFEKAALTLMGLGVTYKEAAAFVLGAQEKAGNGAGAEQVAQRAYADYLAAQKPDEDADDLRQSDGYEDLLKNGTIDTEGL